MSRTGWDRDAELKLALAELRAMQELLIPALTILAKRSPEYRSELEELFGQSREVTEDCTEESRIVLEAIGRQLEAVSSRLLMPLKPRQPVASRSKFGKH